MAASKVKELLDELSATLAELGMLDEEGAAEEAGEGQDGAPAEAASARQARYDELLEKAESLKAKIADAEKREARLAEVRKVLNRAAPAVEVAKPVAQPVQFRGRLRAFTNVEDAYKSGMWLKAALLGDAEARRWCRDADIEIRDMGGQVNSLGGVLVPEVFSNQLIRLVETYGVASNIAQNITMSSDTLLVPRRLTGVTGYWIGENTSITTSDPTASMVQLVAKKLAAATRVSNELLADNAVSVADWLAQEFALEIAKRTDEAFFLGDGTSSYGGIQGIIPKITDGTRAAGVVTATGKTTVGALDIANFNAVLGRLPRYAIGSAAWYMHPSVWHNGPANLSLAVGNYGNANANASFLSGGNTAQNLAQFPAGQPTNFLGLPVVWVLAMPTSTASTTGSVPVICGDLSMSSIFATRSQMSIAASDDRYFEFDQRAYRVTMRADINHHSLGDASNAGPVVALRLG